MADVNTLSLSNQRIRLELEDKERLFFRRLLVLIENMLAVSHLSVEEHIAIFGEDVNKVEEMITPFRTRGSVVLEYSPEEVEILEKAIRLALQSSYFEDRFRLLLGLSESQANVLLRQLGDARNALN